MNTRGQLSPPPRLASWYLGTATASFCETNRGKCSVACGDRCHGNGMPEINASSACSMSLITKRIVLTGGPSHLSEHHSSSASRIPERWGWIHPSSSFGVNTSALT
ncbi:hypothetical protein CDAR_281171 [Caerostris darwini]|uniref:Uncharacterized protein n=1 Tax=Caerostris darwini TaxID=1538125 RepID=A0AAV4WV58_9ARAC|nr:hypothetical protein CDAR_281171 [Caerostris darwini]